jgi:hypothetical protein
MGMIGLNRAEVKADLAWRMRAGRNPAATDIKSDLPTITSSGLMDEQA